MTNSLKTPDGYDYPPLISVVCPKCGHMSSFPLAANTGPGLEYAGVCGTNYEPGLWCDAMLILQVISHQLPATGHRPN